MLSAGVGYEQRSSSSPYAVRRFRCRRNGHGASVSRPHLPTHSACARPLSNWDHRLPPHHAEPVHVYQQTMSRPSRRSYPPRRASVRRCRSEGMSAGGDDQAMAHDPPFSRRRVSVTGCPESRITLSRGTTSRQNMAAVARKGVLFRGPGEMFAKNSARAQCERTSGTGA